MELSIMFAHPSKLENVGCVTVNSTIDSKTIRDRRLPCSSQMVNLIWVHCDVPLPACARLRMPALLATSPEAGFDVAGVILPAAGSAGLSVGDIAAVGLVR